MFAVYIESMYTSLVFSWICKQIHQYTEIRRREAWWPSQDRQTCLHMVKTQLMIKIRHKRQNSAKTYWNTNYNNTRIEANNF